MRKDPTYTPREKQVLAAATHVVCRVRLDGAWKEQEFWPEAELGETTARQVLARVQHALRHHRDFAGILLYVGATLNGERAIASVPHGWMPVELGE